jgi:hypothetical protein
VQPRCALRTACAPLMRALLFGVLLAAACAIEPLQAADPPVPNSSQSSTPPKPAKPAAEPADADFIEFLGSVDSEDEEWLNYLSHTDPTKVAAAKKPPSSDGAEQ